MKKTILAVSALALSAASASAADLAPRYTKAPPPVVAPVSSWTGFYIGANVGGSWLSGQDFTFADPGNAAFNSCTQCTFPYQNERLSGGRSSSVIGGFHLGYNWQFAPAWLIGVEGDFSWTDLHSSANARLFSDAGPTFAIIPVAGSNLSFETDVRWLSTLRGRLGWIAQPNLLVYATGGVAWADLRASANATCPVATTNGCGLSLLSGAPFSESSTATGFVVGGGVEWQLPIAAQTGRWRARVEYLYHGFDQTISGSSLFRAGNGSPLTCNNTPTCSAKYTLGGDFNIQTVRVGLSYAF